MPAFEDGQEDGWSIHVPSTGFQTAEIENDGDPDPLLVSARQLRIVVKDPDQPDLPDAPFA